MASEPRGTRLQIPAGGPALLPPEHWAQGRGGALPLSAKSAAGEDRAEQGRGGGGGRNRSAEAVRSASSAGRSTPGSRRARCRARCGPAPRATPCSRRARPATPGSPRRAAVGARVIRDGRRADPLTGIRAGRPPVRPDPVTQTECTFRVAMPSARRASGRTRTRLEGVPRLKPSCPTPAVDRPSVGARGGHTGEFFYFSLSLDDREMRVFSFMAGRAMSVLPAGQARPLRGAECIRSAPGDMTGTPSPGMAPSEPTRRLDSARAVQYTCSLEHVLIARAEPARSAVIGSDREGERPARAKPDEPAAPAERLVNGPRSFLDGCQFLSLAVIELCGAAVVVRGAGTRWLHNDRTECVHALTSEKFERVHHTSAYSAPSTPFGTAPESRKNCGTVSTA